jgi:hypothetical protein
MLSPIHQLCRRQECSMIICFIVREVLSLVESTDSEATDILFLTIGIRHSETLLRKLQH